MLPSIHSVENRVPARALRSRSQLTAIILGVGTLLVAADSVLNKSAPDEFRSIEALGAIMMMLSMYSTFRLAARARNYIAESQMPSKKKAAWQLAIAVTAGIAALIYWAKQTEFE